jgi:ABC-type bacteriocin/lantibiotic exporter with double-glycine peptidase domain
MKIIPYPETRQVFYFDCGANALVSVLVFAGLEEREDRVALLARTSHNGTSTAGVLRIMQYYGLPHRARQRMKINDVRRAIDAGHPTLLTLQAYRESNRPYRELWDDGHWVVAIGHDKRRILFEDPSAFHRTWLADEELRQRWHDLDRGKRIRQWGCTILVKGQFTPGHHVHMD